MRRYGNFALAEAVIFLCRKCFGSGTAKKRMQVAVKKLVFNSHLIRLRIGKNVRSGTCSFFHIRAWRLKKRRPKKRIIIPLEKSDRISSAFMVFVPNKSPNHIFIRFFGLRFFSLHEKGRDKIVWSVRFRAARRTIVRRGAKSGAEKAKTLNLMQESVRIPTP